MVEGETTQSEDAPVGASPTAPVLASEAAASTESPEVAEPEAATDPDIAAVSESAPASEAAAALFADLRGFQFVGAAPAGDPETYRQELAKELTVRAARFAQSVDDSIVLASDGAIRWLGDPVARLVAGNSLLKPKTLLLADDALPPESRETAQNRLNLWISAHIRKVLGPLEALAEPGAAAEPVRDLAVKVAEALGVLERERVRQQVKALDQSARSALRKLGVRFGATYIFVPALLKPGARTLCSQLWGLKRGLEPGADRLLAYAAAGRTSFAAEATLHADSYRVAGFRLCGDRVVRIDIVERLTDLIRAAIPDQMRPGGAPASDAAGFAVTPQMTSLTGCAGDSFASILRSLGYESHRVKKSDFEAAMHKPQIEAATPVEAAAPAEAPAASATDAAEPERAAETADPAEPAGVETASPVAEPVEAQIEETEAADGVAVEFEAVPSAPIEATPEPSAPSAETSEALAPADASQEHSDGVAAQAGAEPASAPAEPEPAEQEAVPGEAAEEEWIEVWRPAPRRRHQPPPRQSSASPAAEGTNRPAWRSRDQRRHHGGERPAAQGQPRAQTHPPAPEAAAPAGDGASDARREDGQGRRRHEGRRPPPFKGPRKEEARGERQAREPVNASPRKESRPPTVDPNSPFAKLLALRPLLERRDKRT